ncbi:MAG: hypothetical protein ACE5HQ_11820 [Gemmatimonadota bacterium]
MRRLSASAAALAALTTVGGVVGACTEDPLGESGAQGPGASAPTLEFNLSPDELEWRDSAFTGFTLASESPFSVLSNGPDLRSRILGRFVIQDSIINFNDTLLLLDVDSASVRIQLDTINSTFPEFPFTIRMLSLVQGFDGGTATWMNSAEGQPWGTPGGDLGAQIGSVELTEVSDSAVVEFNVPVDSLLFSWQTEGEPGWALVLDVPDARVLVRQVTLRFKAELERRSALVSEARFATPRTFIYDPPQPEPGTRLRVGGVPSWRTYLTFNPPDTIAGIPLKEAVINHAELIFHPLSAPPPGLALERTVTGRPVQLAADPFMLGAKTPLGSRSTNIIVFDPDSLAAGAAVRVPVTAIINRASLQDDPNLMIRIGIRAEPDAQALGFWEFGSAESAPEFRPELLLVITPPPDFTLP